LWGIGFDFAQPPEMPSLIVSGYPYGRLTPTTALRCAQPLLVEIDRG
jgi:hypothetical protein